MTGPWKREWSTRYFGGAAFDLLAAAVLAVSTQVQLWSAPGSGQRLVAAVLAVVLCGAVAVRRRWPFVALLVGCSAVSLDAAFGDLLANTAIAALPAGFLCFNAAGAFLERSRSRLALAAGITVLIPQILLTPHVVSDLVSEPLLLAFAPWLIGRWMHARGVQAQRAREISEQLDAERERRVGGAVDDERIRLARELHDVVGHCLSVIVLQAGGARMVARSEPARAIEAMRVIERVGHEALGEMRHLLGVFPLGADDADRSPQPGLASIEDLVTRTRAAGLPIELTVSGRSQELAPALALCVYRIVQEGLTNAIKHAGPARATVTMRWEPDRLELEITDDGRGAKPARSETVGHGLLGIRERAELHHGSVLTGARRGGGYRLRATLPLLAEEAR